MIDLPYLQITGRTDAEKINQLIAYSNMLRDALGRVLSCIDTGNLSAPLAEKINSIKTTDLKEYVKRPELSEYAKLSQIGKCDYKTDHLYDSTGECEIIGVEQEEWPAGTHYDVTLHADTITGTGGNNARIDFGINAQIQGSSVSLITGSGDILLYPVTNGKVEIWGRKIFFGYDERTPDHSNRNYTLEILNSEILESGNSQLKISDENRHSFTFDFTSGKIYYGSNQIAPSQTP